MFQPTSTAAGLVPRHCSSACCPSSASVILKSRPSRMRRATLRMTLESSPTRQVFMAPHLLPGSVPGLRSAALSLLCGQRLRRAIEYVIDVENDHELSIEAMHASGHPREPRIEIDRVRLQRRLAELHHLADRIDQQAVGFTLEFDADGHRRLVVVARWQAETAPHVDRGDDAAAQIEH